MQTLSSQLQAALNSLAPKNWIKNNYFMPEISPSGSKFFCMCAHGAVAAQCNPQAKLALENMDKVKNNCVRLEHTDALNISIMIDNLIARGKSPQQIWFSRPSFVKQDYIDSITGKNYGNMDLHFLLYMVGLTVDFNDTPYTTFKHVQQKFREAIELAKELEV